MKTSKNLLGIAVGLVICVVIVFFSTSIHGREKTYEIQPQITLPEYRTDTARIIDAYERLMERYLRLTERNLTRLNTNVRVIAKKLDSIDAKLVELSTRMAGIERALSVEQPKAQTEPKPAPEAAAKQPCKKPPPAVAE